MLLLGGEATQTNFIVFGFTQPKMEYTIYCNRYEHTNLYNNEMGFLKGRITLREHLSSPRFLVGSVFLIFLVFCVSFRSECRVVMSITISASERRSVLSTFFVCLGIVVSNTYYVVFLLCISSSCIHYFASFSGLSNFDCSFSIL